MFTKSKIAFCVAIALAGATSMALAANENDGGNETGGFVIPGSMDGVNPVYHPDIFGTSATKAFGSAASAIPARTSVLLPMPGSPSATSARKRLAPGMRSSFTDASSRSRPTTGLADGSTDIVKNLNDGAPVS